MHALASLAASLAVITGAGGILVSFWREARRITLRLEHDAREPLGGLRGMEPLR